MLPTTCHELFLLFRLARRCHSRESRRPCLWRGPSRLGRPPAWAACPITWTALACLVLPSRLPLHAQWKALGPFGGSAALVQVDPHVSGTIVAAAPNALLFRSRDGGETWDPLRFPPQLSGVLHALHLDPRTPGLWLAGISAELPGASGMWRSVDAGSTWEPVPAFRGLQVRVIAAFRGNSRVIAAGADSGVFRSVDGGSSWNRISPAGNPELRPVVSLAFDPKDSSTIYAGTPHLPWKTTDSGAAWRSIHDGMIDDSDVFSILVDRNRPQRIFAGACSGIYRSLNGGAAWTRLEGASDASYRTYTVVQDPQYENVLFAGTTHGMIRSRDGGATWEKIAPYATRSIAFDLRRLGRIFIATDEAGILRSEDNGRSWRQVNRGFCNRRLTPLTVAGTGTVYASAVYGPANGGMFRLPRGADEWLRITSDSRVFGEPLIAIVAPPGPRGRLYAATPRTVLRSQDSGKTWARVVRLASASEVADLFAVPWAAGRILASVGSGLFITRDSARTWKMLELPGAAAIRSLVALDPPWIAALSSSDIFLSPDGRTWSVCAPMPGAAEVHGVAALPGEGLLAATSAGLMASADLGRSWQPVDGPLAGNTIQAICRHPLRPSVIFAARYGLIYSSLDRGRSWTQISPDDWPVCSVKQLVVALADPGRLLVLTHQQGVFVLPLD